MSNSVERYGMQPARLPCPWDSPGKNTGMGCHALLQGFLLTQESNLCLLCLPALACGFFTISTTWEVQAYVYTWLNSSAVHLNLSQHCLSIGYTPIQNKNFKKQNLQFSSCGRDIKDPERTNPVTGGKAAPVPSRPPAPQSSCLLVYVLGGRLKAELQQPGVRTCCRPSSRERGAMYAASRRRWC